MQIQSDLGRICFCSEDPSFYGRSKLAGRIFVSACHLAHAAVPQCVCIRPRFWPSALGALLGIGWLHGGYWSAPLFVFPPGSPGFNWTDKYGLRQASVLIFGTRRESVALEVKGRGLGDTYLTDGPNCRDVSPWSQGLWRPQAPWQRASRDPVVSGNRHPWSYIAKVTSPGPFSDHPYCLIYDAVSEVWKVQWSPSTKLVSSV